MADISSLNGYNLKDAQARQDIATINEKIGSASGIAELDANGRVPSSQLPSYVDDVLEYDSLSAFPATGETGKIYIALDTNKTYRWSGSAYVEISESLALGETSSTAYAGDKGKANADAIDGLEYSLTRKADLVNGKVPLGQMSVESNVSSSNAYPVTSGGVYDAIQDVYEVNGQVGAKNLVDVSKSTTIGTEISITLSSTGFTVSGTGQSESSKTPLDLVDGEDYILTFNVDSSNDDTARIAICDSNNIVLTYTVIGTITGEYELPFTWETGAYVSVILNYSGTVSDATSVTVSNVMVRLASDTDSTYQPYAMTNRQLTTNKADISAIVTYSDATTSASGLMSSTDKTKLDGIEANANNYSLPTASTSTLGGVKVDGDTITIADGVISSSGTEVTVRNNGTASSSATSVQQIGIDGVYTDVDGSKYMEQTITLSTSASVSATFSNASILSTSLIDVFAGRASGDVSGEQNIFPYEDIYTTSGSCVVTFPSFSSAIDLTVRIYIR